MEKKYYRVMQDTFLWNKGAVISDSASTSTATEGGYVAINDIWDAVPTVGCEYISRRIIEHPDNSKYFERVYPDTVSGKLFRTKDQLVALYQETFG